MTDPEFIKWRRRWTVACIVLLIIGYLKIYVLR